MCSSDLESPRPQCNNCFVCVPRDRKAVTCGNFVVACVGPVHELVAQPVSRPSGIRLTPTKENNQIGPSHARKWREVMTDASAVPGASTIGAEPPTDKSPVVPEHPDPNQGQQTEPLPKQQEESQQQPQQQHDQQQDEDQQQHQPEQE